VARSPWRVYKGIGIQAGYSSDSAYLADSGGSPVRGDVYFNTTSNGLRYYDGAAWQTLNPAAGVGSILVADWWDTASTVLPSTGAPFAPDGTNVSDGEIVVFADPAIDGYYRVSESGGNVTAWTQIAPLQDSIAGVPTTGDLVFVRGGTVYEYRLYARQGSSWVERAVPMDRGTATNQSLYWNGFKWVLNGAVLMGSGFVRAPDDSINDSAQAASIELRAGDKLAGTGDGGDLDLRAGTSFGGLAGRATLGGYTVKIDAPLAADPVSATAGEIYYNNVSNEFRYYDGVSWSALGSGGGGILKVRAHDPVSTARPTGNPVVIDGVTIQAGDWVLFSGLSSDNFRISEAVGTGTNITSWLTISEFNGISDPTAADMVVVEEGDSFALQVGKFSGTDWVFNDKVRYFNGVDYWEESALNITTLADNQVSPDDVFTIAYSGSENIIVDYSISRSGNKETGSIYLTTDGTNVGISTAGSQVGSSGITFSADISGADLRLRYVSTSTGSSATCKFIVRRWSDAPGGPGGPPSYTGGGGGSVTGSGVATQLAYWDSGSNINANSNFALNLTELALDLGDLEVLALRTDTLLDNQVGGVAFQYDAGDYPFAIIEYSIQRDINFRVGRLLVATDGTTTSLTDDETEVGLTGIVFSADISGGNVRILYTSSATGDDATMKWSARRWA